MTRFACVSPGFSCVAFSVPFNVILCILFCLFFCRQVVAGTLEYTGEARDLNSAELLYTEWHRVTLHDGKPVTREVRYTDPSGRLIAIKNNHYQQPLTPDFDLQDQRRNYRETLQWQADGYRLTLTEPGESPRQKNLKSRGLQVADAGFDELIRQYWPLLLAGQSVTFEFISVARLGTLDFTVQKRKDDDDTLVLQMSLASPLLSWLLEPIELGYDKHSQRLLYFRGLTNMTDGQGEHYRAEIRYRYP